MNNYVLIYVSICLSVLLNANLTARTVNECRNTQHKGFLVSTEELTRISEMASKKIKPHYTNVNSFLTYINNLIAQTKEWTELSGEIVIRSGSSSDPIQLSSDGGKLVYGAAIAWHLTNDAKYAELTKKLILDLTDTYGYSNKDWNKIHEGAQGILNLACGATPYIFAADLLEDWEGWSEYDKIIFQKWLRDTVYPRVAWSSRTRKNNWGVAGSFSAAAIAYYLMDQPNWKLEEFNPYVVELSPQEAFNVHNYYQIKRQSTADDWKMDAKTFIWGIQPNGAIPEEIRRGSDPVNGDYLASEGGWDQIYYDLY